MPVITVSNIKGGCGKSTLSANLAVALTQQGKDVLIVDSDPSVTTLSTWEQDRQDTDAPMIPVVHKMGMLHRTLSSLAEHHDVVIVDVPGKDSQELRTALTASALALIPVLPSQADIDATTGRLRLILDEAREYNPGLVTLAVLNRVSTHVFDKEADDAAQILMEAAMPLAEARIYDRTIYRTSLSEGLSVSESENSKARNEVQAMTTQVLAALEGIR